MAGIRHDYALNGSQIVFEIWESFGTEYLLYYIYDEIGSPIGIEYRTSNYGLTNFDRYYFEKNLQGDVIGIYNADGKKICTYNYDAWGNFTTSLTNGITLLEDRVASLYNPFRYRSYYYDTETGWYYLQSRYYNPEWGRFLNADGYVNANGDILGFNMFAYCSNNPVMGYDPTGEWNWRKALDVAVSVVSIVAGVAAGLSTSNVAVGAAVTGTINNTVNAVYYHFSNGNSDLEQDTNESSYVSQGYIDRFSRLDYVKSQLGGEYTPNAWRYYSEYNFHMYAWMAIGWAYDPTDTNQSLPAQIAKRARKAEIDTKHWDGHPEVDFPTFFIGVLGV